MDEVTENSKADEVGNDAYYEQNDCQPVGRVLDEIEEFHGVRMVRRNRTSGEWLVEIDGDSLVSIAEGSEVFGKNAAGQKLAHAGCSAEVIMLTVNDHGVWAAAK